MRKIIIAALVAATALPGMAMAQNRELSRDPRHDLPSLSRSQDRARFDDVGFPARRGAAGRRAATTDVLEESNDESAPAQEIAADVPATSRGQLGSCVARAGFFVMETAPTWRPQANSISSGARSAKIGRAHV